MLHLRQMSKNVLLQWSSTTRLNFISCELTMGIVWEW